MARGPEGVRIAMRATDGVERVLRMPSCRRLFVVAHPHEELCAAGGLRGLVNRGVPVSILAVTDSGAEYLAAAYRTLTLTGVRRYRLGLPGG
jgi:LmbE family N-acetylglucosaminyl deacetylase